MTADRHGAGPAAPRSPDDAREAACAGRTLADSNADRDPEVGDSLCTDGGGGTARTRSVPLRHNRDFLLLWTGQAASAVGSSVASIAYPLLALAAPAPPPRPALSDSPPWQRHRSSGFRLARWQTATHSNRS